MPGHFIATTLAGIERDEVGSRIGDDHRQHLAKQDMHPRQMMGAYEDHGLVFPRPGGR